MLGISSLPAPTHPSPSPQLSLEHSPGRNQSKLKGKTRPATSAFPSHTCTCGHHRHQTRSLALPSHHFSQVFCTGGHIWVPLLLCFVRLGMYCTSSLSLYWFSSCLLENGIDQLEIRKPLTAPASLQLQSCPQAPQGTQPPPPALWPLGCLHASPHLLPRWRPVRGGPPRPLLSSLSCVRVWSQLPPRSLLSHRRDPHDQLSAAALGGPLFMRS